MRLTRRHALAGGAAAVAGLAGLGGVAALKPGGVRDYTLKVVERVFGADVAASPAALEFAREYEAFTREKGLAGHVLNAAARLPVRGVPQVDAVLEEVEASIIEKFATSTDVVLACEQGRPVTYYAMFHPYENPCTNQLGPHAVS